MINSSDNYNDSILGPQKILLTTPILLNNGGVANYFHTILAQFPKAFFHVLQVGSSGSPHNFLNPILDQIKFRSTISHNKFSLCHLNPSLNVRSFFRDGLFAWQAKIAKIPFLVFWRGWDKAFEKQLEARYKKFFDHTFLSAAAFIVLSLEVEEKLRQWGVRCPIYRETTIVGENLVKDADLTCRWQGDHWQNQIKILFLSRLEKAKGVFETIEAIRILIDSNFSVSLTIAGDGKAMTEAKMFAAKLGLRDLQVCFTGDIRGADKIKAFLEHHIYCLPSHGEGLPNSVLEAMAFGMPVITTAVGGLKDIFIHDQMGKLVQQKSPQEIANAIASLIEHPENMVQMGAFNTEFAREHFMASVVSRRLSLIYQEVLGGSF